MRTTACGGNKYFLAMETKEQKYMRIQFIKSRADVMGYVESYVSLLARHSRKNMGRINTANALEFIRMKEEWNKKGIILTKRSQYSLLSNGLAK